MHGSIEEVIIGHQQYRHTEIFQRLQYKSLSATDLPSLGYVNSLLTKTFQHLNQLQKPTNLTN